MREIIFEMNDTLCLPIDFTASSILVAIATVIGNTHVLKFKNTWKARPILYMVLLGNPGVNKSHPLETIFQPLVDYDREQERKFLKLVIRRTWLPEAAFRRLNISISGRCRFLGS